MVKNYRVALAQTEIVNHLTRFDWWCLKNPLPGHFYSPIYFDPLWTQQLLLPNLLALHFYFTGYSFVIGL